jgi:Ran GTPase-activating protein (RanGAP) involved in mRNA processing and transport
MVSHLATLVDAFPGAANQTRCFTHILNLVAKSVLRQFEAPTRKEKGGDVLDDAAKELAAIFDELEDVEEEDGAKDFNAGEDTGENDEHEDDDNDGLVDVRGRMSKEELAGLEKSVKPFRLVLTKVSIT